LLQHGSGFGLMTIIAGVDRGFVPRAVSRLTTAMNFLEKQSVFTAWPHWMNGNDGKIILQRQRRRSSRNIISLSRIIDR
jgi:hypothetical protein